MRVAPADVGRCTCDQFVIHADGQELRSVAKLDPDCRVHGLPKTGWPANHPLRRHARVIDRLTGERLTVAEARDRCETLRGLTVDAGEWMRRFRDESARETEARLLGRHPVAYPLPLRRCPPRVPGGQR